VAEKESETGKIRGRQREKGWVRD